MKLHPRGGKPFDFPGLSLYRLGAALYAGSGSFSSAAPGSAAGFEYVMNPRPISDNPAYTGSGKLQGKVAIITGGDSGIGRAVAIAFAKEGADLVIPYLDEHQDAADTRYIINQLGRTCLTIAADLRQEEACQYVVEAAIKSFGGLNILVNNHGVQFHQPSILDITQEQLINVFQTNIISFFLMTKQHCPIFRQEAPLLIRARIPHFRVWQT